MQKEATDSVNISSSGNEKHQVENDTSDDKTTMHFTLFKWNQVTGIRFAPDLDQVDCILEEKNPVFSTIWSSMKAINKRANQTVKCLDLWFAFEIRST